MRFIVSLAVFLVAKRGFEFTDNSDQVKRQFTDISEQGMLAAALIIEGRAKALATVQTGEMRDKIDHSIKVTGSQIIGTVGSPTMHAFYVEFGTGEFAENGAGRKGGWVYKDSSGQWFFTWGQDPQPFLRPAFRRSKKDVEKIIAMKLKSSFRGK